MSNTALRSRSLPVRCAAIAALCASSVTLAGSAWADAADAGISPPTPYPGTIQISVDARDTAQGIIRVHEVVSRHMLSLAFSIGLALTKTGEINDAARRSRPVSHTGATVVAVNGHEYSAKVLASAMTRAEQTREPIRLLLKYQGEYETIPVPYYGGPQYPHLVRIEGTPDDLDQIIAPKK
ncbi:MAG: hypothetical protein ACRETZ_03095 [Steroidobacteraceae bacterium]